MGGGEHLKVQHIIVIDNPFFRWPPLSIGPIGPIGKQPNIPLEIVSARVFERALTVCLMQLLLYAAVYVQSK